MKDRWIFPEPLCASSGKLVHAFMWRHVFLQAVFPNIVQFAQFPYVIDVNCLIYTICTSLLYSCFVFCFKFVLYTLFQTTFYILHVNSCIHITRQIIMQEICIHINMFHDVVTFIWTFWFLMKIVLHIIYLYISYTVTLHLSYYRHTNFQK